MKNSVGLLLFLLGLSFLLSCGADEYYGISFPTGCFGSSEIEFMISDDWIEYDSLGRDLDVYIPNGHILDDAYLSFQSDTKRISRIESWVIRNDNDRIVFSLNDFEIEEAKWDGKIEGKYVEGVYSSRFTFRSPEGNQNSVDFAFCATTCDNLADNIASGMNISSARWSEGLNYEEYPSEYDLALVSGASHFGPLSDCF